MAAAFSLCPSLAPKLSPNQKTATPFSSCYLKCSISDISRSFSNCLTLKRSTLPVFVPKSSDTDSGSVAENESEIEISIPESEISIPESETVVETTESKPEEVFAVVMVGGRQYIVFPGRYIYTQRLKGADVNDKITLNKVLLVGTKTSTYIGKPIVPNTLVHAIVEEQKLDKKVIVYKYKKKKNYRRNIGHRQPITRIKITSITGFQDTPAVTLDDIDVTPVLA